jgi:hypothetical protein
MQYCGCAGSHSQYFVGESPLNVLLFSITTNLFNTDTGKRRFSWRSYPNRSHGNIAINGAILAGSNIVTKDATVQFNMTTTNGPTFNMWISSSDAKHRIHPAYNGTHHTFIQSMIRIIPIKFIFYIRIKLINYKFSIFFCSF